MANALQSLARLFGLGPMPRVSPMKEMGASGTAVYGGRVITHERDARVIGQQRWTTYSDLLANTSIVAAGTRYFLNVVAHADWSVEPSNDTPEAQAVAEFVDEVMHDMVTPWARVSRRAAMYRFNGFGIQEWTAKRRKSDGKIGLEDIESRPAHTIEQWDVDEKGSVNGVWQRSVQTGQLLPLPRGKILYLVEDTLTDSPEGMGLFRHCVDPYIRQKKYRELEGTGFERDLRGIPIGRVPYAAIAAAVNAGQLSKEDGEKFTLAIETFVAQQSKTEDTSLVLDSAPYIVDTDTGRQVSSVMQYGIELLQGQTPGFSDLNTALMRLDKEMARILGVEHLLLGDGTGGNRALSEDKSRNFYLTANGTLDEIGDGMDKDVVTAICDLNGVVEDLRPHIKHSDVSFRAVSEITKSLTDMATAGAVLAPDDPAIDDVRDMLGISKQPERTPEEQALMLGNHITGGQGMPGDQQTANDNAAKDKKAVEKLLEEEGVL